MPCSNSIGERSFLVLKSVRSHLHSSLANYKTSSLFRLCKESEVVKSIDWNILVQRFSKDKDENIIKYCLVFLYFYILIMLTINLLSIFLIKIN
jgi:hypothetical protein